MASSTYALVGMDFGQRHASIDALVDYIGDAITEWSMTTVDTRANGKPVTVPAFRMIIARDKLRNTVAHGIASRAGWVAHTEVIA